MFLLLFLKSLFKRKGKREHYSGPYYQCDMCFPNTCLTNDAELCRDFKDCKEIPPSREPKPVKKTWFAKVLGTSPDPVLNCEFYRHIGCTHVDGMLCDVNTCSILKEYRESGML